jgi:hypothetical protein
VVDVIGHRLAKPAHPLIGDRGLDRLGTPAANRHRSADADPERPGRAGMVDQRSEQVSDISGEPVERRALRQVGQILLDLGQLPVEHQPGADDLVVGVDPADRLAAPLPLHLAPRRRLQEADAGPALDVRQVLGRTDGPHRDCHGEES